MFCDCTIVLLVHFAYFSHPVTLPLVTNHKKSKGKSLVSALAHVDMFCCGENLGAEQSAQTRCALTHVCLCVFSDANGCPVKCAFLLLNLAALVKLSNITVSLNHSHPLTSICV